MTFHEYVRKIAKDRYGEDSDEKIARRVDTTGKTVGSWKTAAPAARFVIEFARQYGVPMPEAFMAAYGLTADELGVHVSTDPRQLSNDQLIEEIGNRLRGSGDVQGQKMSAAPGEEPAEPEPGADSHREAVSRSQARKTRRPTTPGRGRVESPESKRRT